MNMKRERKVTINPIIAKEATPEELRMVGFLVGQAEGALAVGSAVVKVNSEEGDSNPNGTRGVVISSFEPITSGDFAGEYTYFILWETFPVPIFVRGGKVKLEGEVN